MSASSWVEVRYKAGVVDPAALGLLSQCRHAGFKAVKAAQTAQLYRLTGDLSPEDRRRIMVDLLADPLIQEPADASVRPPKATTVDICYKAGVTDVAAESVLKGIRDLGVRSVTDVRTGTRVRFPGLRNQDLARRVAKSFLANPLIQDVFVYVD